MGAAVVLSLGASSLASNVESRLVSLGWTLLSPEDTESRPFGLLVAVLPTGQDYGHEFVSQWLQLVNSAERDLLLTQSLAWGLPAGVLHYVNPDDPNTDLDSILVDAGSGTIETISLDVPRILHWRGRLQSPYFADSVEKLHNILTDSSVRVAAVSTTLYAELQQPHLTSRRVYDVARFLRWSADRLDRSYTRLRLRQSGSELADSSFDTELHGLDMVLEDQRSSNLVLVKGSPGAGKSSQLRFLEATCALASIREGSSGTAPMPFCVNLGEHAAAIIDDPLAWLGARWERRVAVENFQSFHVRIRRGNMVLMLDGLNEIPFSDAHSRREWMLTWKQCIADELLENSSNTVVVACRTRDLNIGLGTAEQPQTTIEVLPLDAADIVTIARRRNPAAAAQLVDGISDDPSLVELYNTPFTLAEYLDLSVSSVPRSLSEIFWRRICASLERERHRQNFRIFDTRWLPEDQVTQLLGVATLEGALPYFRSLPLFRALGSLAQELTAAGTGSAGATHSVALDINDASKHFRDYLDLPSSGDGLKSLLVAVDLDLLLANEGVIKFTHQTMQEFLAASLLDDAELLDAISVSQGTYAERLGVFPDCALELGPGEVLSLQPASGFEEVFARAAEVRAHLIEAAVERNAPLAAELIARSSTTVSPTTRDWLTYTLRQRAQDSDDPRERLLSLLALGENQGYDAQPSGNPVMVEIPASEWRLGCSANTAKLLGSGSDERTVLLDSFKIGVAPITNHQFARFVDAGGYKNRIYWSEESWEWRSGNFPIDKALRVWLQRRDQVASDPTLPFRLLESRKVSIAEAAAILRFGRLSDTEVLAIVRMAVSRSIDEPAYWNDSRYSNPVQPVVGVSPYEADAYCEWLSQTTGKRYRLPTEDEWEAAALFTHPELGQTVDEVIPTGRWSRAWGNVAEVHIGAPTPAWVFSYQTASPTSCMIGNVFEWIGEPFRSDELSRRVCKGGSWRHLMRRASPGYRGRGDVTTRNDDDGFRIVCE